MDDKTKHTSLTRTMRLDDTPDGVTVGMEHCRGFHLVTSGIFIPQ